MLKNLLAIALLFLCLTVKAQNGGQLTGRVLEENHQAIAGALIEIKELKLKTTSDQNGNFVLKNIPKGTYLVSIRHVGHLVENKRLNFENGQSHQLEVYCKQDLVQLETIMVTAEKRENQLQKIPMAVSAISGKQIAERNVREISDLTLAVPNLMTTNFGSPTLNMIALRGVLTFSMDPVVGVYVDGIPMFDGYSTSQQFQDIERVEVLRGPQSTLYGRAGLGGVINILTKKPGNETRGFAEIGLGNYNSQRYNAGLSGALIKNKLFVGFSGLYNSYKGFYTNDYTNKAFDHPQNYNGNFYLKYLASDRFSLTLNAKGEYNDVMGTFPYVSGATNALKKPYHLNQDAINHEKRKLYGTSLQALYRLAGAELSSVTGYSYLSDKYVNQDVDYSVADAILFETPKSNQNTFTQEFKLSTDNSKKLKFTGGLYGFIDRKDTETNNIYRMDIPEYGLTNTPFTEILLSDKRTYGVAAFASLTYALSEQWEITGGLRYDYEKRNMLYRKDFLKSPNPPVNIYPETKIKGNDDAFSPRVSISYLAQPDLLIYATYSRGYRPGGLNNYTANINQLTYRPEYTTNYELGLKSEWLNKRLRANLALFYLHWKDQQQTVTLPIFYTDNVGELNNKGAELELTGVLMKGLEINYNLGLVHTNYKKLILADPAQGKNVNYEGNKQIFTPDFTSALSISYRHQFNAHTNLYFIPEWKYFGKQYMTLYNDLEQKPFNLINVSIGAKYKNYELGLWAKNLGAAQYISFAYATQTAAATPVLLGAPRTLGATVKVNF